MFTRIPLVAVLFGLALMGGAAIPSARSDPAATAPDTAGLAKTKVTTAKAAYEATVNARRTGRADAEQVYLWSRRWMEAERDVSDKPADRVAAAEAHLERMKALRKDTLAAYQTGNATHAQAVGTEFYVAEAELWLAQAKAK